MEEIEAERITYRAYRITESKGYMALVLTISKNNFRGNYAH